MCTCNAGTQQMLSKYYFLSFLVFSCLSAGSLEIFLVQDKREGLGQEVERS